MEFDKELEKQLNDNSSGFIALVVLLAIFDGEVKNNDDRRTIDDSTKN